MGFVGFAYNIMGEGLFAGTQAKLFALIKPFQYWRSSWGTLGKHPIPKLLGSKGFDMGAA